jgi:hypothetical protein
MVPKRSSAAVRRDHRLLQRVLGVLGAAAAQPGDPVQLPVVAEEQLLERIAIARDVSRQQFGVATLSGTLLPNLRGAHRRTVTNDQVPGTSLDRGCQSIIRTSPEP